MWGNTRYRPSGLDNEDPGPLDEDFEEALGNYWDHMNNMTSGRSQLSHPTMTSSFLGAYDSTNQQVFEPQFMGFNYESIVPNQMAGLHSPNVSLDPRHAIAQQPMQRLSATQDTTRQALNPRAQELKEQLQKSAALRAGSKDSSLAREQVLEHNGIRKPQDSSISSTAADNTGTRPLDDFDISEAVSILLSEEKAAVEPKAKSNCHGNTISDQAAGNILALDFIPFPDSPPKRMSQNRAGDENEKPQRAKEHATPNIAATSDNGDTGSPSISTSRKSSMATMNQKAADKLVTAKEGKKSSADEVGNGTAYTTLDPGTLTSAQGKLNHPSSTISEKGSETSLEAALANDNDLKDWLEFTGYNNEERRKKGLSLHRSILALDAEKAKLLAETDPESRGPITSSGGLGSGSRTSTGPPDNNTANAITARPIIPTGPKGMPSGPNNLGAALENKQMPLESRTNLPHATEKKDKRNAKSIRALRDKAEDRKRAKERERERHREIARERARRQEATPRGPWFGRYPDEGGVRDRLDERYGGDRDPYRERSRSPLRDRIRTYGHDRDPVIKRERDSSTRRFPSPAPIPRGGGTVRGRKRGGGGPRL